MLAAMCMIPLSLEMKRRHRSNGMALLPVLCFHFLNLDEVVGKKYTDPLQDRNQLNLIIVNCFTELTTGND